jgi:hypothetical protein
LIDDFASIGVEIRLSAQGYNIITDRTSVGDYDLWWDNPHNGAVLSLLSSEIEPLLDMYQDKYYVPIGEPLPEYDYVRATRFKNPEVNTLASQMSQISPTDPSMEPLEHRAVEIFMEQLPSIPIAQFRRISVFSERYWTGYPTEDNFYVLPHESMCEYRFIIDTIQPTGYIPPFTDVTYVYVWFVADVETFRGADGANYGPYGNGEFVRIPETDANRLIAAGSATTQPSEIPGIGQILQAITSLATSTSTGFDDIRESLNNQLNTLTAGLIIEAIAIIVLIALVAVMLLKRSK